MSKKARQVRAKKKCCTSKKRCKRCPILLTRLARHGWAEPVEGSRRDYLLDPATPKSVVKELRKR